MIVPTIQVQRKTKNVRGRKELVYNFLFFPPFMNLRITECLRVEGAPGDGLVQPPCSEQGHLEQAGGRVRSGFEHL